MRPDGIWERQNQLRTEQRQRDADHPEHALRRALTWLVHECALLAFDDISTSRVVERYRTVLSHLDDPAQQRTGSALEVASLEAVARLRSPLARVATTAERHALRDEVEAEGPLLVIPPEVLMGRSTRDAYFPMACWNAAGSHVEGIITAYRAASMITHIGYHDPPEEPELLAAIRRLRERYEDEPVNRPSIGAEIGAEFDRWLQQRDRGTARGST